MLKLKGVVLITLSAVAAAFIFDQNSGVGQTAPSAPEKTVKIAKKPPVVVELFTSEGCSSCPPADALLARIYKSPEFAGAPIIAIAEHVDYFNSLGWADPYSKKQFTERQQGYVGALRLKEVYTPQMIVDGRTEFLGHNEAAARAAISAASKTAKATVSLKSASLKGNTLELKVDVEALPATDGAEEADVLVGVTEDNLSSSVSRGENAGRKLTHGRVLRGIKKIGVAAGAAFHDGTSVTLQDAWKKGDLTAVVLVQGHDTGHIYGAAAAPVVVKP